MNQAPKGILPLKEALNGILTTNELKALGLNYPD